MNTKFYMDKNKRVYEISGSTDNGYPSTIHRYYKIERIIGTSQREEIQDYIINDIMFDRLGLQELTPDKQEVAKLLYGVTHGNL